MCHWEHLEGDDVCIYVVSCVFCTSRGDITVEIEELLDHRQTQSGKEKTG